MKIKDVTKKKKASLSSNLKIKSKKKASHKAKKQNDQQKRMRAVGLRLKKFRQKQAKPQEKKKRFNQKTFIKTIFGEKAKTKDIYTFTGTDAVKQLEVKEINALANRMRKLYNERLRNLLDLGLITKGYFKQKVEEARNPTTLEESLKYLARERARYSSKSSTVEGIKKMRETAAFLAGGDDNSEFWDLYKQLYNESSLFEKFKYKTFDVIREELDKGNDDVEKIRDRILTDITENQVIDTTMGTYYNKTKALEIPSDDDPWKDLDDQDFWDAFGK